MRYLVLGGCGFIGSHVVDHLAAAGHEVRVVARKPEVSRGPVAEVDYVFGDCGDRRLLSNVLDGVDGVFHVFSATTPGSATRAMWFDVEQNLGSALTLLELMAEKDIRRLVYLSSGGTVYGVPDAYPIRESQPLRPVGSYAIVKAAVEGYIGLFARERGLLPVILRPANTYGERQGRNGAQGAVSVLMQRALSGEPFEIWGDGSVVRDFLHVEDLARLCVLAVGSDVSGTFNAGSGLGLSLRDLVALVAEVTGRRIEVRYGEARSVDVPVNILDIAAAKAALGWSPRLTLREGLARTWDWHLAQSR